MTDPVDRLFELADRARRLPPPSARNPEAFHEARSELAHDLAALARELDRQRGRRRTPG